MKRLAEKDLYQWYLKKDRMPLILRGARQVGKSTLVRLFCDSNGLNLIEINLELTKINSIRQDNFNINDLLNEVQLLTNKKLNELSLIFFDEIQEQPKLIQLLRYFYELKPGLAVIAAGSLLEIALKDESYSFPVGRVEFYHLGPMSFGEFLLACGQNELYTQLEMLNFSHYVHSLAKDYFRKFLYIGGMPKVILSYINSENLVDVQNIQAQIIQTYLADFPKYNKKINSSRIARIFSSSVYQMGRKLIYQAYDEDSKSRDIKRVLELLIDAKILVPCYHSNSSGLPIEVGRDEKILKLFFLDVGLLNCSFRHDYQLIEDELQRNFLNKGIIAEQFVAQHLMFYDGHNHLPNLNYWLRDKGSQKGEIDFIIQDRNKIIPIEVKAEKSGRLKSLFYFAYEKKWPSAIKLSLEEYKTEKIRHKINNEIVEILLINFPIYAVEFLKLHTF